MPAYFDEDHFPEMLGVALRGSHLEEFCRAALTFIHTEASLIHVQDLEAESEVQERVTMVQNLIGRIRAAGATGLDIQDFIHVAGLAEKLQADTDQGLTERMIENAQAAREEGPTAALAGRYRQLWRDETFTQLLGLFSECLAVQEGREEDCRALHRESAAQWVPDLQRLLGETDKRESIAMDVVRDFMAEESFVNNLRPRGSVIAPLRSEQLERHAAALPALIGLLCDINAGTRAGKQECDRLIQEYKDFIRGDISPQF